MDANRLGEKYACYQCGCKFYDMKKARPVCPKCGANQDEAPSETRSRRSKKDTRLLMGE